MDEVSIMKIFLDSDSVNFAGDGDQRQPIPLSLRSKRLKPTPQTERGNWVNSTAALSSFARWGESGWTQTEQIRGKKR